MLTKKEIDLKISQLPRVIHVARETLEEVARITRIARTDQTIREGVLEKESHQSIRTSMDMKAQEIILKRMRGEFPKALIVTEEEVGVNFENSLANENDVRQGSLIMVVDPLDGTAQCFSGLDQFSLSLGLIEKKEYVGGVISSPVFGGGFTVYGTVDGGVFVKHGDVDSVARVSCEKDIIGKSVILYGVDLPRHANLYGLLNKVSREFLIANSMGSCALGLAMLAIGKVDGFVQSPQEPWDWAAGYPLVLGAGGYVQFYEINSEKEIILIKKPELRHMILKGNKLGFVAANSLTLLKQLQEMLMK